MTKKLSLADINARNAEFRKEQSRVFNEQIAKRPHDLKHVVDKTQERIEDGAFKKVPSLESQMAELGALRDADQSVKAKSSRQRARGHADIVTESMRVAVKSGYSLPRFLKSAATEGNWPGITIEEHSGQFKPGTERYTVSCDEMESKAEKVFAHKTLSGWWTIAKTKKILS